MLEALNTLEWSIWIFLILVTLVQVFYYIYYFSRVSFYKLPEPANTQHPVSVIIAARNEYANLEKNLVSILEQDYPEFEVIVINDCSWDDSQKLLEYYQEKYAHLKVSQLIEQEKYPTGKKFALTIGIKAAKYEHLLFTDADCVPLSDQWLRLMQSRFEDGKEIILGFSPYKSYNGLLNLFIRYECVFTAISYMSAALRKNAFMGIGRNLAYTRSLFFQHKGFAGHQHITSGDDDLFVNQAATKQNVRIQLDPKSFVLTEPKRTIQSWIRQNIRHVSTGKRYKLKDLVFLGGYYLSHFWFYVALAAGLIFGYHEELYLACYLFRLLVQLVISYFGFNKMKSLNLIWFLPILDLLYMLYILVFGTRGLFSKGERIRW